MNHHREASHSTEHCFNYSPALNKWRLYWIHPVRHSFFLSVILSFRHNSVFAQYLENKSPIETKFCIHIITRSQDKIYVGIVNCCFSQIGPE